MQILNVNSLLNVYFLVASRPLNRPSDWRMCLGKHHMNSSMDVPSAEECYKVDHIIKHEGFVYEQDKSDITNVMPPQDTLLRHWLGRRERWKSYWLHSCITENRWMDDMNDMMSLFVASF